MPFEPYVQRSIFKTMSRGSLIILLGLVISHSGNSLSFGEKSKLVSDGIDKTSQNSPGLELDVTATTVTCKPIYGFLPCATSVWGQLFMIITYELLLYLAEKCVFSGSKLFFRMFGTGVFCDSLFNILGTMPQVGLLLAILTGSTSTIETLATMGMGLLAGSTIMLLTLIWASVVAFGSYNLTPVEGNVEPAFSLTGHGVHTDDETYQTARIMMVSMIPFLILQLAKILNSTSGARIVVLVSLIVTLVLLSVYCNFRIFHPWIWNRSHRYLALANAQEQERTRSNYVKAALLLFVGTAISAPLGLPLLQTVQEFSSNVNIPSFLVTYVVVPVALNIRQALATITSARERTENAISLTFSEIYNGVFMNNMMGLAAFLAFVYIRDLSWNVSAEILVVLLICTAMGLFTSFRTTFPFWTCILVLLLYFLSLLIIYVLTEVVGWT